MGWKATVRDALRRVGVDVRLARNVPSCTFLGLGCLPVDVILDVGANVGQFARYSRALYPRARLHCFEPLPGPASELRKWAAGVGGPPVVVWETAIGDSVGEVVIHEHLGHSPSSSILRSAAGAEKHFTGMTGRLERCVPITTLDAWEESTGNVVDASTLIKLDVQGFEAHVVRGGCGSFNRAGICVTEITPLPMYQGQCGFAEVVGLMHERGLEYLGNLEQYADSNGLPMYMDAVFVRPALLGRLRC